jgi:hypothetical protein
VKYTAIILNLYCMVHSNVWKFDKIWLSSTLIIIRKPKVWWTDRHGDPYIPPPRLSSSGGIKRRRKFEVKMLFTVNFNLSHSVINWMHAMFKVSAALFLLENRDFLGFRMLFKVWLNQIFSNFNTMLWTIQYRLRLIMVYFTFTIHKLWPFFS